MNPQEQSLAVYILVNHDLSMSTGKVANQVAHAVQQMVTTMITRRYEVYPPTASDISYRTWENNPTKIVLRCGEEELTEQWASRSDAIVWTDDDGDTKVPPGSLTVVLFPPGTFSDTPFAHLKLL
jgi:peptidyl-tRNA hydrolase